MAVSGVFSDFQQYLDQDFERKEEIRTVVRDLEQTAREIQSVMQAIHQTAAPDQVLAACQKTDPLFVKVKAQFSELAAKIPVNQYYRFNDQWRFVIQRLAYLSALKVYLMRDQLISQQETADILGVKVRREDGFHIDLDDFLMGVLTMASELARFAVNAVVSGDPGRPIKVSQFLAELDSGFRLLNLKNDMLRKKFDSLKYSVQKVEGVVYDLTIRSLVPSNGGEVPSKD
ncbi:translin-like [Babylonia areolata]|uniref:translin-like n=1 Tax=Babylonia areolata TaxID=304850 RepID=UPI003FD2C59F